MISQLNQVGINSTKNRWTPTETGEIQVIFGESEETGFHYAYCFESGLLSRDRKFL